MITPSGVSLWGLRALYAVIVVWLSLGRARDTWRLFLASERARLAEDRVRYLERKLGAAEGELHTLRRAELVRQGQDTNAVTSV